MISKKKELVLGKLNIYPDSKGVFYKYSKSGELFHRRHIGKLPKRLQEYSMLHHVYVLSADIPELKKGDIVLSHNRIGVIVTVINAYSYEVRLIKKVIDDDTVIDKISGYVVNKEKAVYVKEIDGYTSILNCFFSDAKSEYILYNCPSKKTRIPDTFFAFKAFTGKIIATTDRTLQINLLNKSVISMIIAQNGALQWTKGEVKGNYLNLTNFSKTKYV